MGARDQAIEQAVSDFSAYVQTLDYGETVGELVHMSRFHNHVMAQRVIPGVADRLAAVALGALAERLRDLSPGRVVQPSHDGGVHSCILLARMLAATTKAD